MYSSHSSSLSHSIATQVVSASHRATQSDRLLALTARDCPPEHRLFEYRALYVDPTHPRSVGVEVGAGVVGADVGADGAAVGARLT